jgi:type IV pilus assembly protein PilP
VIKLLIAILATLNISACKVGRDSVKEQVRQIKSRNVTKIEELPVLPAYQQVSYNSGNLQDPFFLPANKIISKQPTSRPTRKIETVKGVQKKRPDYDRPREYLENYSLDSLTMVGTLKKSGEMWALIVDKSGIIHKVRIGNYLGQNSGKITDITEERIAIKELVPDSEGGWTTREANVGLKQ